jgi:hypothetical protein
MPVRGLPAPLKAPKRGCPEPVRCSEDELQRQLHGSRSADLIQRIEAAILAVTSRRCARHLRRLPE